MTVLNIYIVFHTFLINLQISSVATTSIHVSFMAANTKQNSTIFWAIPDSTLKEYELITLIYNRISYRLDLLSFWAPENIIL